MTVFDVTLRNKLCRPNYVVADKVSSVSRWRAEKVALAYISYISAFDIDSHRYSHRQQRHRARDWLPTVVTIRFVDCSWATATGVSCSSNGRRWCTNGPRYTAAAAAQVRFSRAANDGDRHLPLGFTVVWRRLATANNVKWCGPSRRLSTKSARPPSIIRCRTNRNVRQVIIVMRETLW